MYYKNRIRNVIMILYIVFGIIKLLLVLLTSISTIFTLYIAYSNVILSQMCPENSLPGIDIVTLAIMCTYEVPIRRGIFYRANNRALMDQVRVDDIIVRSSRILIGVNLIALYYSLYYPLIVSNYYYGIPILIGQFLISYVVCLLTGILY
jgi:hypothetical protein